MRWSLFSLSMLVLGCNAGPRDPGAPEPVVSGAVDGAVHERPPQSSSDDPYAGLGGDPNMRPPPEVLDAGPIADPYH